MKTVKTSLANMQGKLSRTQMKNVTGGILPWERCESLPGDQAQTCLDNFHRLQAYLNEIGVGVSFSDFQLNAGCWTAYLNGVNVGSTC